MPQARIPQRVSKFLAQRNRSGLVRARNSLPRILRMTLGAIGAFWIASAIWGHTDPIFAATSALISLGFGAATTTRRTAEVALGCTLGVALGDGLMHWWGQGIWQAAAVMSLSLVVARYLDSGAIFSTQLGMQSALVVLLPVSADGPFARSFDAMTGSVLALLIIVLWPSDPRRTPIGALSDLLKELSEAMIECSWAVRDDDHRSAFHALIKARATQRHVEKLPSAFRVAKEIATLSPTARRHRHELARLALRLEHYDRAARNSRVFARRLASVLSNGALTAEGAQNVAPLLRDVSEAVNTMAHSVREPTVAGQRKFEKAARHQLEAVAAQLDPRELGVEGLQGEGLVLLLRPLVVDLLQAAGRDHQEAVGPLPRLS
ncbi:FUSC family protein [Arthrobacter sp. MYb229]|uniref:FUSC family protein n=1 Tax=unclassified Arthrobacter TaxID=235627 RepID=UPI000CFCF67A|nr:MULTISPECIES: FUSC family protein [unclassified Arthrobacter]PRA03277.1 FUSC family protein [Arthrobacter sp. MYb229]PRB49748.1 FUSC family protein [Arthrobacter sp. MYb216]